MFGLPSLPLDKDIPRYVFERRGAISLGFPTSPRAMKSKLSNGPRLSRRGGVSVDSLDVEAKHLRLLGDGLKARPSSDQSTITRFTVRNSLNDLKRMQSVEQKDEAIRAAYTGRYKRKMSAPTVTRHRPNDTLEWSQLNRISCWEFDTLSIERITRGRSLFYIGFQLLVKHDLFEEFNLDVMAVLKFLNLLEQHYEPENPFHNATHAADVAQALHCLLVNLRSFDSFTPTELLASILASLAHDVNHPGVNQNFLIKTASYLSKINGNTSLLEQHHSKVAKSLIKESGIISHLNIGIQDDILGIVEDLIMATDMAQHQTYVNHMKALMVTGYDPNNEQHRRVVLRLAMKCSDLCNTARPWGTCVQWGKLVLEEFWRQGDEEKRREFTVLNMFDREQCVPSKALTGFIDYIANPLFTLWADFCDSSFTRDICRQVDNNRSHWEDLVTLPV